MPEMRTSNDKIFESISITEVIDSTTLANVDDDSGDGKSVEEVTETHIQSVDACDQIIQKHSSAIDMKAKKLLDTIDESSEHINKVEPSTDIFERAQNKFGKQKKAKTKSTEFQALNDAFKRVSPGQKSKSKSKPSKIPTLVTRIRPKETITDMQNRPITFKTPVQEPMSNKLDLDDEIIGKFSSKSIEILEKIRNLVKPVEFAQTTSHKIERKEKKQPAKVRATNGQNIRLMGDLRAPKAKSTFATYCECASAYTKSSKKCAFCRIQQLKQETAICFCFCSYTHGRDGVTYHTLCKCCRPAASTKCIKNEINF